RGDGHLFDRVTQAWVRATGRTVSLAESGWLDGPVGDPAMISERWIELEAVRRGGYVREGGGLLASLAALRSETFDPSRLAPSVVDFYEHTGRWRMEVWSQWLPAAIPAAWLLSTVFARRLHQLALPLRPLDVAEGIDSRVLTVMRSSDDAQIGAAWLR